MFDSVTLSKRSPTIAVPRQLEIIIPVLCEVIKAINDRTCCFKVENGQRTDKKDVLVLGVGRCPIIRADFRPPEDRG